LFRNKCSPCSNGRQIVRDKWHNIGKLDATRKAAELLPKRGVIEIWPETNARTGSSREASRFAIKKPPFGGLMSKLFGKFPLGVGTA
jgi:hypothetical protein